MFEEMPILDLDPVLCMKLGGQRKTEIDQSSRELELGITSRLQGFLGPIIESFFISTTDEPTAGTGDAARARLHFFCMLQGTCDAHNHLSLYTRLGSDE